MRARKKKAGFAVGGRGRAGTGVTLRIVWVGERSGETLRQMAKRSFAGEKYSRLVKILEG
jgi:hypothetical protein